ncbi:uncharacterized protein LOC116181918 [Photinus pyralis]|uniref:uncharacterized protein LOC116162534 n=1 Tax=Photinus pyralis TaxID=7054 RepID=UPI00126732D0|nr:uncharacterized protein LOC116162534 [Photinus pyralis]XP_031340712.1 uncharacterized protein LOC116168858 [Photinus pyralis]XP_031358229.1 uncharacterized protein LOC116181918 [Photinus pyralis]
MTIFVLLATIWLEMIELRRREEEGSNTSQQVWLNIIMTKLSLVVGVVYKSPEVNGKIFCDEFEETCSEFLLKVDFFICLGDLNINILDTASHKTRYYLNMLECVGLVQIINEATRSDTALLDHILVSDINRIRESGIGGTLFADHETIFCEIEHDKTEPYNFYKTTFKEWHGKGYST